MTPNTTGLTDEELTHWWQLVGSPRNGHEMAANINTVARFLATISQLQAENAALAFYKKYLRGRLDEVLSVFGLPPGALISEYALVDELKTRAEKAEAEVERLRIVRQGADW